MPDHDDETLEAIDHNDELDPAATHVTRTRPLDRTQIEAILAGGND